LKFTDGLYERNAFIFSVEEQGQASKKQAETIPEGGRNRLS
jgi:hypothetical protein